MLLLQAEKDSEDLRLELKNERKQLELKSQIDKDKEDISRALKEESNKERSVE